MRMKRGLGLLVLFVSFVFIAGGVSADDGYNACDLDITLLNQDPYPAEPGHYVKAVFQVNGVNNPNCGEITFQLDQNFPFSLDPGAVNKKAVQAGVYAKDFSSFWLVPYDIRIDDQALDGDNKIDITYTFRPPNEGAAVLKDEFEINVEGLNTDFEISIKDYDSSDNTLTFEVLNIGENDIDALTVDIPKQTNIEVKGSKRNIVGGLDSNEDTTFSFEAIPTQGEIVLNILYTDQIGVRRSIEKSVEFDPTYYTGRARDEKGTSPLTYIIVGVFVILVVYWLIRRARRKKKHMHHHS
jgi:hypothetical protein